MGAIIDSSKISQMRTAHHRGVEYLKDERPDAEWLRCHALIGVETMVCMAVPFGGNRGLGKTHDSNFAKPLVSEAIKQFNLQYLLADKAYFGAPLVRWLWDEAGIKPVIPTKKRVEKRAQTEIFDPYIDMIMWYDQNENRDFHEVYRLRPKIEGFFSLLKRVAQGYFSAKGRPRRGPDGVLRYEPMADGPCTAWKNEALCKFIFMNLRTTTRLEDETRLIIDYLIPERCFPKPAEPLLREFRAA
ncbi:MAG TPA: transposase [Candidatus Elarobacter sp.]|nr:transposase [Candidatus Elarobacter sp.]